MRKFTCSFFLLRRPILRIMCSRAAEPGWWDSGASQDVSSGTLLAGTTERVHVTDLALNGPEMLEVVFEPDGWECPCRRGEEHWRLRRTIPYREVTHDEEASPT
jgi:hypothetical protein